MILQRFYDDKLAQTSYLIGCAATGESLVVDPNRDTEQYVRAAAGHGVRITHVAETHIHADFVSGMRELAVRTGAKLHLSDEAGDGWEYAFAESDGAVLLKDGDSFHVGRVAIQAIHTPGHTPEHLSFLVTDTAAADKPFAILTGDFVFVGDVGRPDLLERAAGVAGTMESGARALFHSLRRFRQFPDYLQILPGHGAGSACGKDISAVPSSTVGYERMFNWAFSHDDEVAFVEAALGGQPEPPTYFAHMKRINREGPPVVGGFPRPERHEHDRMPPILESEALVVDTRNAPAYAERHIPGTINIPLNRSFNTWAGWLVPYDQDFHLIVDEACESCIDEAVRDLAMIGLDRIAGWFDSGVIESWRAGGRELGSIPQLGADALARRLEKGTVTALDVRGLSEWEAGHIPGVGNIPVGHLTHRLEEIPRDRPIIVHCQTGGRSAIAASLLRSNGFEDVTNLVGGYEAWKAAGRPTERNGV